jgi:hypothetical protein
LDEDEHVATSAVIVTKWQLKKNIQYVVPIKRLLSMEKTMKTTQELEVELALLKSDIEKQYEVLSILSRESHFY